MIVIDYKMKEINTRRKYNALVKEDFKDEDKEIVKDVSRLSVTTIDRLETSQEAVRT